MTDWDLLTPGIGLSSLGIVTVGVSSIRDCEDVHRGNACCRSAYAVYWDDFPASGLFKDGFPSSGKAKSATFITLGFLVTFGLRGDNCKHPGFQASLFT